MFVLFISVPYFSILGRNGGKLKARLMKYYMNKTYVNHSYYFLLIPILIMKFPFVQTTIRYNPPPCNWTH